MGAQHPIRSGQDKRVFDRRDAQATRNMRRITFKHLSYFVAAAEACSIKIAAEKINISQPSISSAISHLEEELQVQLFVRHHAKGLTLTQSGQHMMREAKLLLRRADQLYAIAGELNNEIRGKLTIGFMVTLAPMIAPQLVHKFRSKHTSVELHIAVGSHADLVAELRKIDIDVAISYDLPVQEDIEFEPLADLPPHVMVSADNPLAKRKWIDLAMLNDKPMIMLDLPFSREYFLSLYESKNLTPNITGSASNQDVIRTMVANDYGYSISNVRPKNLTALDGKKLSLVKLSGDHKPMRVGIATLAHEHKTKTLVAFQEHCRKLITNNSIPGMS